MSAHATNDAECARCGCTEDFPCVSPAGDATCCWVLPPSNNLAGLCSACATEEELAMFEHVAEVEANKQTELQLIRESDPRQPEEPRFRNIYLLGYLLSAICSLLFPA